MAVVSIGYDGTVDEAQWAKLVPSAGSAEYGVKGAGDWKVTAHPSTAQAVNIAVGTGWGQGVMDTTDAIITVQCDTISSGTRWDLIMMHRDWTPPGGSTTGGKITGTTTKQIPPRSNTAGVTDDQPLALVQWTAGQTQPTAIVDLRCWAGNGGMVAKDELAYTYLTRVGAQVTINGSEWKCLLGDNDAVQWTKVDYIGGVSLFGAGNAHVGAVVPNGGADFLMQAGTSVVTPDGNGFVSIILPKAFPNSLVAAIPVNADNATTGRGFFVSLGTAAPALDRFHINISNGSGVGYGANDLSKLARIDWIAIGR